MKKSGPEFTILQDTREQTPWNFDFEKAVSREIVQLKTGDYTIKGLEDIICIERKASATEVALNLISDFPRFERELERMDNFLHCYAIFEFPYTDLATYPDCVRSPIVRNKIKITGGLLINKLMNIQLDHKVKIIFCDNKLQAAKAAVSLMKRINERYGKTN